MGIEAFRNIATTNYAQNQARVTLGADNALSVQQKVSAGDKLGRAFRVNSSKANIQANNAVRRELAESLGRELGISTKDYGNLLKTLQKTLGKDVFNADYFKESGLKSGRPLSSRRITQIVSALDTAKAKKTDVFWDALSDIYSDAADLDDGDISLATTSRVMQKLAEKTLPDTQSGLGVNVSAGREVSEVISAKDKVAYEAKGYTVEKMYGQEVIERKKKVKIDGHKHLSLVGNLTKSNTGLQATKMVYEKNNFTIPVPAGDVPCTREGALKMISTLLEAVQEASVDAEGETKTELDNLQRYLEGIGTEIRGHSNPQTLSINTKMELGNIYAALQAACRPPEPN